MKQEFILPFFVAHVLFSFLKTLRNGCYARVFLFLNEILNEIIVNKLGYENFLREIREGGK